MTVGISTVTNSSKRILSNKTISRKRIFSKRYSNKTYWFLTFQTGVTTINGLALSSQGYIYTTGATSSGSYVNKIDTHGNVMYQKNVSASSGQDIDIDSSGNLYICDTGRRVIKLDETATSVVWTRLLSSGTFINLSIDQSTQNIFVSLTATVASDGNSGGNGIMSWNSSGTFNGGYGYIYAYPTGTYWTTPLSRCVAGGGGVFTVGNASQIDAFGTADNGSFTGVSNKNNNYQRGYTVRYQWSDGSVWNKFIREPQVGGAANLGLYGTGIALDSSYNSYVCFYRTVGSGELYLAKYNSSGTLQWQVGRSGAIPYNVAVDPDGNPYVVGYYSSAFNSYTAALISKYNSSGTMLWTRSLTYKGAAIKITDIRVDSSSIYISGFNSTPLGFVAKLPNDGSGTGNFWPFIYSVQTNSSGASGFNDYSLGAGRTATIFTSSTSSTSISNSTATSAVTMNNI